MSKSCSSNLEVCPVWKGQRQRNRVDYMMLHTSQALVNNIKQHHSMVPTIYKSQNHEPRLLAPHARCLDESHWKCGHRAWAPGTSYEQSYTWEICPCTPFFALYQIYFFIDRLVLTMLGHQINPNHSFPITVGFLVRLIYCWRVEELSVSNNCII